MVLEQSHDNRRGYIIWEIRNHFDRFSAVFLLRQFRDVHFQHIFIDDAHVVKTVQRVLKNRDQRAVNLYGNDFLRRAGKVLCHGSDPRSDLQYTVVASDFRGADDLIQNMRIDQKVLTELFLEYKMIFLKHRDGILRIAKCRFFHICLLSNKSRLR